MVKRCAARRNIVLLESAALAILSAHGGAGAMAQLADPNFDVQGISAADFCYIATRPAGAWSGVGSSGLALQSSPSWVLTGSAASPSYIAIVQGYGLLTQTVTVPTAGRYRIAWWDAGRSGGSGYGGGATYQVKINGSIVFPASMTSRQLLASKMAIADLAADTAYTLSFQSVAASDQTSFIDSVTLALATEQKSLSYDALGRLSAVSTAGPLNGGTSTSMTFDAADNR